MTGKSATSWRPRHVAALIGGNTALALGPWWVRIADTGPVAAGFWRLALAVPLLVLLARANGQRLTGLPRTAVFAIAGAGLFFALDLASWHLGIRMTRLANATLFGNSGSIILMAWGLIALRRRPRLSEGLAVTAAIAGASILLGRSLELGRTTLLGDLLCLLAGFLYTFYILLLQRSRASLGNFTLLTWSTIAGVPVLLGVALLLGERIVPQVWWPLIMLALTSQVLGQGLLVYSLGHFPPLVIGLALLTQPTVAVFAGWLLFGEMLSGMDTLGMALVAAALVLARGSSSNAPEVSTAR